MRVLSVARVIADVEVLAGALALSRTVLEEDPCQLASQIIGRLGQILAEDKPVAPGTTSQPRFVMADVRAFDGDLTNFPSRINEVVSYRTHS